MSSSKNNGSSPTRSSPQRSRSRYGASDSRHMMARIFTIGLGLCIAAIAIANIVYAPHLQVKTAFFVAVENFVTNNNKDENINDLVTLTTNNVNAPAGDIKSAAIPNHNDARLADLSCKAYGGPDDEFTKEIVYWYDIPSDNKFISPLRAKRKQHKQYITFEPDGGGWNNIRMALEIIIGIAIATGRTLVMPPAQKLYLLGEDRGKQKVKFGFADFFPIKEMAEENAGLNVITMKQFLEAEAMKGNMKEKVTGKVSFPPENRTEWEGQDVKQLREWLRTVTNTPIWNPVKCLAVFPTSTGHAGAEIFNAAHNQIKNQTKVQKTPLFDGDPPPLDATPLERMKETLASRKDLCLYDEHMQGEAFIHFMSADKLNARLFGHFYAFLFFEDWRQDLWMKRFVRDHVRYIDEVQCAAARIVHAMREHVKNKKAGSNPNGDFDTFHIRRGDFQYPEMRISAEEVYENTKDILEPGATIYIGTDERNKTFFAPLKQRYDIKFMNDFQPLLEGINTNYYGMIDQLVAARGRNFIGCYFSTFTGYINRVRGYYSQKEKAPGHEKGYLPTSYYYVPKLHKNVMHKYSPLQGEMWSRDYPTAWRRIDASIGNLPVNMIMVH